MEKGNQVCWLGNIIQEYNSHENKVIDGQQDRYDVTEVLQSIDAAAVLKSEVVKNVVHVEKGLYSASLSIHYRWKSYKKCKCDVLRNYTEDFVCFWNRMLHE